MRRILAAVLLVLAASPLTAPFSIGDPLEWFAGDGAQIQSKKAPDTPTAHVDPASPVSSPLEFVRDDGAALVDAGHTVSLPLNRPLRV